MNNKMYSNDVSNRNMNEDDYDDDDGVRVYEIIVIKLFIRTQKQANC